MRTPALLITILLFMSFTLPPAIARGEEKDPAPPTRVTVTAELPAMLPSFDGAALVAVLYEYDPFLADAAATQIETRVVRHLGHQQGVEQSLRFTIGDKLTALQPGRRYYISCRIYEDKGEDAYLEGKQLHYCHNEHDNLPGTVYDEANGKALTFTAR